jgi:hypothetical protein
MRPDSIQGRGSRVAEVDEQVMRFVEETLKKSPKIQLEDLFERAKKVSKAVNGLTRRQFNARYPLQVKRRRSQARRSRAARGKKSASSTAPRGVTRTAQSSLGPRESVRQVFLQFATDITGAEERKDLVRVLASVDTYVDQVLEGVSKA